MWFCGAEVIEKYRDRIRQLEDDIVAIEDAEKEEKEMRVTELKANKAQNMLEHRDEILARPKRTWFQTHAERMQDVGVSKLFVVWVTFELYSVRFFAADGCREGAVRSDV